MSSFSIETTVLSSHVGDQTILLDLTTGTYHSLNETGSFIWDRIEDGLALDEIAARLADEYEISIEGAAADAQEFIDSAANNGLLQPA